MTGKIRSLDRSGHTTVEWDTEKAETVAEAMAEFDRLLATGASPFDTSSPEGGIAMNPPKFDPTVSSITMVPRMAGG